MLVKHPAQGPSSPTWLTTNVRARSCALAVIGFVIVLAIGIFLFNPVTLRAWMEDHGYVAAPHISPQAELSQMVVNWLGAMGNGKDVTKLVIDVKFKHLEKLRDQRSAAVARGILFQGEDDFVPGTIHVQGRSVRVKLRLKGDWTESLTGDKWAFRIHVKGKEHVFGLRRFSLHHPMARDYHGEPMILAAFQDEGILTPRYFFVDVVLNGDFIGRMALEEHFSNELLATQKRRESVIIKFDESLLWNVEDGIKRGFGGVFDNYASAKIIPFRGSKIEKSEVLKKYLRVATGLIRSFVSGSLPASQVYDADLLGRFIAVAEVWGSWHCLRWHNMRFYYNPIAAQLEPIAFDAMVGHPYTADGLTDRRDPIVSSMLNDPAVGEVYRTTLKRIATDLEHGALIKRLEEKEQDYLKILRGHYPLLRTFDFQDLQKRATQLVHALEHDEPPTLPNYPAVLQVFSFQEEGRTYLELGNAIPLPVEVLQIQRKLEGETSRKSVRPVIPLRFPLEVPGSPKGTPTRGIRIQYQEEDLGAPGQSSIIVTYRVKGKRQVMESQSSPYFPPLGQPPIPVSTLDGTLAHHAFLTLDEEHYELKVKPGRWNVKGSLVIPSGYGLKVSKGTVLQFEPAGKLIVRGPLMMEGTREAPIILEGQAKGELDQLWQGILVFQSNTVSEWSFVSLHNTTGVRQKGWGLTGGVTFYESEIHMKNCTFRGNRAEDALNIIRTHFNLTDVNILEAMSDGLDADFADGTLQGGLFEQIGRRGGGDAIDVSGSDVLVNGTQIRHVKDKGLSVGEGSTLQATDLTISEVGVGAVSKDGSVLTISDSHIDQAQYAALMAYAKKPEYGAGTIQAKNMDVAGGARRAVVQTGSVIVLDGISIPTEDLDVDTLYATVMKRGKGK